MTLVDSLVAVIKSAGQPTEADSQRDGFLSYKSESHALGLGLAAGFFATAHGETRLLALVYAAAVYGRSVEANSGQRRRLWTDIRTEPHYALGGAVAGSAFGILAGWVTRLAGQL
ncbi:hypothetical protein [Halorussus halobius]|uniref:hypothetical protein n=1 Tax=Halorussus halobius TaxID=1710537 RepID=UPI001091E1BA|nr:hypothetical protein [Halorussus halobius]